MGFLKRDHNDSCALPDRMSLTKLWAVPYKGRGSYEAESDSLTCVCRVELVLLNSVNNILFTTKMQRTYWQACVRKPKVSPLVWIE